ncbi:hypothetical protein HAX54_022515, partial [Datura stramonium]|nr:hypothetical protein [Datura stramonium]
TRQDIWQKASSTKGSKAWSIDPKARKGTILLRHMRVAFSLAWIRELRGNNAQKGYTNLGSGTHMSCKLNRKGSGDYKTHNMHMADD